MPSLTGQDIAGAVGRAQSIVAGEYTATGNGVAVDLINASEPMIALVVAVDAVSGTSPTLAITVEESDDGSTGWVAVPSASLVNPTTGATTTFTAMTDADSFQIVGLRRQKVTRYVRIVYTIGGTSPVYRMCGLVEYAKLSPNTGTV